MSVLKTHFTASPLLSLCLVGTTQGENTSKWFNLYAEIKTGRMFEGWMSNSLFNSLVYSSATGELKRGN